MPDANETGRHPMFVERIRRAADRVPPLRVDDIWEWNEPDRHAVRVLALDAAATPWPRVTCRFIATGTVVTVGGTAFAGATQLASGLRR